ncbi:MAG: glycerol-3-phosphate acyltransferase [Proteobacteria bacterium]|nr:glycerol-3-phosphate acyltransferase [Pseudomonadota bacterium]
MKWGKGVATGLGCILFVEPLCAFISGSVYLIFLGISKISAVGSLTGLIACLVYLIWVCPPSSVSVLIGALCLIILTRHKENILRLKESWKQRSKTR